MGAFSDCSQLSGVISFPSTIKMIGSSAFSNCTSLTGVTFPDNLLIISSYLFEGCTSLEGSIKLPIHVRSIGSNAFYGCTNLTGSLILPEGLEEVSSKAFASCTGFSGDLVVPSTIKSMAANAFEGCSGFTGKLIINEGVRNFNYRLFKSLNFTELQLPSTLEKMGYSASFNTTFTRVECQAINPPVIGDEPFYGLDYSACTLVVPNGSKEAYQKANIWKNFTTIKEQSEMVTTIDHVLIISEMYVQDHSVFFNLNKAETLCVYDALGGLIKMASYGPGWNSIDGLGSGIYIINGKKIVVN